MLQHKRSQLGFFNAVRAVDAILGKVVFELSCGPGGHLTRLLLPHLFVAQKLFVIGFKLMRFQNRKQPFLKLLRQRSKTQISNISCGLVQLGQDSAHGHREVLRKPICMEN